MAEQIEQYMRQLKLGGLARTWRSVEYHDREQYVTELLQLELREREINRINRLVKTAGFHVIKTLDDFVWNSNIELPTGLTREYMTNLEFLPPKENLIFMGAVGTGKTHLATAISLNACQLGHRVRFFYRCLPGEHAAGEKQQGNAQHLSGRNKTHRADCSG